MKKMKEKGFANLPQEVKIKAWPKPPSVSSSDLDDTITGIDKCMSQAASKRKSKVSNQK